MAAQPPEALPPAEVTRLVSDLTRLAATAAEAGDICVFNLIDHCQEALQAPNAAAEAAAAQAAAAAAEAEAAAEGSSPSGRSGSAKQSLWHQMQQREEAAAAAAAAGQGETSLSGVAWSPVELPQELWALDEGLFAEEGAPAFVLPALTSPHTTPSRHPGARTKKATAAAAAAAGGAAAGRGDGGGGSTPQRTQQRGSRLSGGPGGPGSSPGASPVAPSHVEKWAGGQSSKPASKPAAGPSSSKAPAATLAAAGAAGDKAAGGGGGSRGSQEGAGQLPMGAHSSLSFSRLPPALQALLNSGDVSRRSARRGRRHSKQTAAGTGAEGGTAAAGHGHKVKQKAGRESGAGPVLVFGDLGDLDLSGSSDAPGATAGGSREPGQPLSSSSEDDEGASESASDVAEGCSSHATPEEAGEGINLKTQLLLGHLLLLATGHMNQGAAGDTSAAPSQASHSSSTAPSTSGTGVQGSGGDAALLQLLAGQLREAGLLPKWVHWLLTQPGAGATSAGGGGGGGSAGRQRLFDRTFQRLFAQVGGGLGRGQAREGCQGMHW